MNPRLSQLLAEVGVDPQAPPTPKPTAAEAHAYLAQRAAEVLRDATPALFRPDIEPHRALDAWATAFAAGPASAPSLLLVGTVGTGKTHQAYQALRRAVLGAYAEATHRFRPSWAAVKHREFNSLNMPIKDPTQEVANRVTLARLREVDLLLFDDLGSSRVTDWSHDALLELMDVRLENCRPTLWTSNLADSEWSARFDDRIVDRLDAVRTVTLVGESRRAASQ